MNLKRTVSDDALILSDGEEIVMIMHEVKKDNVFEIALEGSLKSDVVHDLQDELESLVLMGFGLRVDLQKVTYVSPSCEKAFVDIQRLIDKSENGSIVLCKLPQPIQQQFERSGMSELLVIE